MTTLASSPTRLKISARKSDLARLQAQQVGSALQQNNPNLEIEYSFRESLGDKNLVDPLWKIPEKGVFTEDFMQDLLEGKTDLVVHSWKDLPTEKKTQTMIAATLPRADARDLLLMKKSSQGRSQLRIYSSSPRREANIGPILPELLPWKVEGIEFESVRGNIQTRVKKLLESSNLDGLILAKAALDRLLSAEGEEFRQTRDFLRKSLLDLAWMVLPLTANPNAAAQGALAVEIRSDREDLQTLLQSINCEKTFTAAQRERELLQAFGGGCHLALGMSVVKDADWTLTLVKGKTPAGERVERREIQMNSTATRELGEFSSDELWSLKPEGMTRKTKAHQVKLEAQKGYVVSRIEAWPVNFSPESAAGFDLKIWTSGLKTWKKLAKKGIWVLGTFDGLGDHHPPATGALLGDVEWVTLTHQRHPKLEDSERPRLATYETEAPELMIKNQKFFFWRSSSQFLQALRESPWIRERFHAAGPGSTLRTLKAHIPEDKLFVFLSEEDWRKTLEHKFN